MSGSWKLRGGGEHVSVICVWGGEVSRQQYGAEGEGGGASVCVMMILMTGMQRRGPQTAACHQAREGSVLQGEHNAAVWKIINGPLGDVKHVWGNGNALPPSFPPLPCPHPHP